MIFRDIYAPQESPVSPFFIVKHVQTSLKFVTLNNFTRPWGASSSILVSAVNFSRGVKRQIAHSTVKIFGNFLAPEPWQFCSDFLFGPNYEVIRCYFELNILENSSNGAMIYFDFGA